MKRKTNKKSIVFLKSMRDNEKSNKWNVILQQAAGNFLFQMLVLWSAVTMYVSVFPIEEMGMKGFAKIVCILLGLILVFDVILPFLYRVIRVRFVNYLIQLLLTAVLLFCSKNIFYGFYLENQLDLEDGLLAMGQKYLSVFNSYFGKSFMLPPGQEELAAFSFLFCLAIAMIVQFALTKLVCKKEIAVLTPTVVFVAELVVGKTPGALGIFLWSASWIWILAGNKQKRGFEIRALLLWTVLFGCSALMLRGVAEHLILQAPTYKAVQKQLEEKVKSLGTSNLWGYRETISNKAPEYSDELVLLVHADKKPQGALYLKAFTGSTYSNSGWTEDKTSFKKAGAGYDTDEAARLLWLELGQDVVFQSKYGINQIDYTVTYGNSMSTRALVPYFSLVSEKEAQISGDWGLTKSLLSKGTSVTGPDCNEAAGSMLGTYLMEYYSYHADASSYKRNPWNWYNKYAYQEYCEKKSSLPSVALWADNLRQHEERMDIARAYSSNSYDSMDMSEQMEYLEKGHDSRVAKTNRARLDVAGNVQAYLKEKFTYSWNLDTIEDGVDPVEYFLSTGKRGYCMHFASAGVLLLRELGVPARYAAGYIVKPGTFYDDAEGGFTAEVMDRNAHAWIEIYLDNTGWVPVEMTPGYTSNYEKLPTDKELAVKREQKERQEEESEQKDEEVSQTESETEIVPEIESETEIVSETESEKEIMSEASGGLESDTDASVIEDSAGKTNMQQNVSERLLKILPMLLKMLAAAGLVCSMIYIIRKLVKEYHEKLNRKLRSKKYRGAVRLINRRIYNKLRRMGKIRKRYVTDTEYEEILGAVFTKADADEWRHYMEIVKKAAFSDVDISKNEAYFCHKIYQRIVLDSSQEKIHVIK